MDRKLQHTTGFLLLVLAFLLLTGCGAKGTANATANPSANAPANTAATPTSDIAPVLADESVIAEGKLVPARDSTLSFTTGGVVKEVLVSEGDTVQAGQPLLRLEGNEQLQAAISAAEVELLSANQAVDDLNNGLEVQRATAQQNLANAEKALDTAKTRMYSKDWQRGSQSQVDVARANYIIAQNAAEEAEETYDRYDGLDQDDPIRAQYFSQFAAAKQLSDKALANLNYLLAKPNKLDLDIANANFEVAQANANEAVRKLNLLKDGPDPSLLAVAKARVQNAEQGLKAARSSLDDLELRAPYAGTITDVSLAAGEFASPGTPVVHMADFSTWLVETTDLTELSIPRVNMGQPAMVRFDALKDVGIIGRVTKINAQGENKQGDVVYTVTLKLEPTDAPLRWNMTAAVTFLEK